MNDVININISEEDSVEVTVHDNIVYLSKDSSFYNIEFQTDTTSIWAIFSKFTGKIIDADLTNVDSYKIDGSAVSLPFTVEFDRTYLIEIVKTNPSLSASIKFETTQTAFTENIELPDFSIGDGKKTYGIDIVNGLIYKLDNTLATTGNTTGVGTWGVDLLENTITLPTLPSGGTWDNYVYLKNDEILVAGHNSGNTYKYLCYLMSDDTITDMTGILNNYTQIQGTQPWKIEYLLYDYINDKLILIERTQFRYIIVYDLQNDTYYRSSVTTGMAGGYISKKVYFNPFKKVFILLSEVDFLNKRLETLFTENDYRYTLVKAFNRNTGYVILESGNTWYRIQETDQYSQLVNYYIASGQPSYTSIYHFNINHAGNVCVWSSGYDRFAIARINDNNKYAFELQYPESTGYIKDGMFAFNNLHCLFKPGGKRVHFIDASDPEGTPAPDFNYYDFPTAVDTIITNRIL